jgi:tRNA C32,U32 (ribose-2'-O)-methylase TrmJ
MESFPSLNLAQAVMVVCYVLFRSSTEIIEKERRLALAGEVERMFEHMEEMLLRVGFLDPNNPKRIMRVLRRLLGRSRMDEREVQILQGIWSQIDHVSRAGGQGKTKPFPGS